MNINNFVIVFWSFFMYYKKVYVLETKTKCKRKVIQNKVKVK
jgi:hypothetical protein